MNFAQRQADPRRHLVGMTIVVLFHALVVYALVTGLAKQGRRGRSRAYRDQGDRRDQEAAAAARGRGAAAAQARGAAAALHSAARDPDRHPAAGADDHRDHADAAARARDDRPGAAAGGRSGAGAASARRDVRRRRLPQLPT